MKWTFIIQQKMKVALLLFCIMALIIVTTLLARKNIGNLDKSFHSIYNDRLIPATDIFYLTENLYQKRLLMEKYLLSDTTKSDFNISEKLAMYNQNIDSLIHEFYKTYLVVDESKYLSDFENMVKEYEMLEHKIIRTSEESSINSGQELFYKEGMALFEGTIGNLQSLTKVQTEVGKKLMAESEHDMANVSLLYTLQMVLVFIIGAMVQALIFSSKITRMKHDQKYNLN